MFLRSSLRAKAGLAGVPDELLSRLRTNSTTRVGILRSVPLELGIRDKILGFHHRAKHRIGSDHSDLAIDQCEINARRGAEARWNDLVLHGVLLPGIDQDFVKAVYWGVASRR